MKRLALVTGAASGLGKEFAGFLARDDYNLILVDINQTELELTAGKIKGKYKTDVKTIVLDLGLPGAAEKLYKHLEEDPVDILINNAGFGLSGFFSETDWRIEESMICLHVLTPTHLTKLVLKDMLKKGRGKIMNVASVAAFTPGPTMNIYYASKAYLLSFSRALANELKGTGVSVTTFCPGLTRTRFSETRASLSNVPKPRLGALADSPEKVAAIGYKAMLKGKVCSVPVLKNRIMVFFTWLMPVSFVIRTIRRSQDRLQFKNKTQA